MKRLLTNCIVLLAAVSVFLGAASSAHANQPPVAVARLAASVEGNGTSHIFVSQGVPTKIDGLGSSSSDPDGWADVSNGGTCEWNTDFNRGNPTYEHTVTSPGDLLSGSCDVTFGNKVFNDPLGTYTYSLLRVTDRNGASNVSSVQVTIINPANRTPFAIGRASIDGGSFKNNFTVQPGQIATIRVRASESSDPDGWGTPETGVAIGGRCQTATALLLGNTFDQNAPVIQNPASPSVCNSGPFQITFPMVPALYTYTLTKITDASGAVSPLNNNNLLNITVSGVPMNNAPVAVAQIQAGSVAFGSEVLVSQGVSTRIRLGADYSNDPNGWSTTFTGVSQGGKCEWNTDLNQGTIIYERTITSPATPASCNIDLGTLTFNDPPGRYIYPVLRITDATGEVSNVASVTVIVTNDPTPTPTVLPTPTPSCSPFGYNSDCVIPTPSPTPVPSPSETFAVSPSPFVLLSGSTDGVTTTTLEDYVVPFINAATDAITYAIGAIARLFGIDPATALRFIQQHAASLASTFLAAALALSLPFLVTNILPHVSQWGRFFGSFFGARRRKDRWGIVVDSDLGKPISGAVVQLFDAKFHQLKETQITGPDGQFGFLLPPGQYYVVSSGTGFLFPARKRPPVTLQDNERIYLGEEFSIAEQDPEKIPHLIVPMDRELTVSVTRALTARYVERLLAFVDRVGFVFLFVGAAINTYLVLMFPGTLNICFEILYLVLFALKLYILLFHQQGIGTVTDEKTGMQLDLAIIRLYHSKSNRIIQTRVTNKNGRFFLLVPMGTYTVAISKQGYETRTMSDVKITGSASKAISLDFALKGQG